MEEDDALPHDILLWVNTGSRITDPKGYGKGMRFAFPNNEFFFKTQETSMKEMFEVFNMGHRLEIYCDEEIAQELINISSQFNVEAKVIGRCEEASEKSLTINDITY